MREFLLMNKDNEVMSFKIVKQEGLDVGVMATSDILSPLPIGYHDIGEWLKSRYSLSSRIVNKNFFKALGIEGVEDFIGATNCVSLNDTFWVKGVDSELSWKFINPYKKPINKEISKYILSGKLNSECITSSLDFFMGGSNPKCWKRENGVLYLCKTGSSRALNMGNEVYSEVYACNIASRMGIRCVPYGLSRYGGELVSVCPCMCSENIGFSLYSRVNGNYSEDYEKLLKDFKYSREILDILLLDYVICNVGRSYANFGYLIDNSSQKVKGLAPVYGNNLACMPYYMSCDSFEEYINDIKAKDGRTFDELFELINCRYVRGKLKSLVGYDASIGCNRDAIMNKVVEHQIRKALK